MKDELDPVVQRQLGDKLSQLQAAANPPPRLPNPGNVNELPAPTPLEAVSSQQKVNQDLLAREIANEHRAAELLSQTDPRALPRI